MKQFKEQLASILGLAQDVTQPEEKRDVIELTTLDDFRNNIQKNLNGIKIGAVTSFCNGTINNNPILSPVSPQPPMQPPAVQEPYNQEILIERDNEIGVDTLKGAALKMGPKGISEVISKMSTEKNKTNKDNIAISEFDLFVDGLKQESLEVLLGKNIPVTTTQSTDTPSQTTPEDENKPKTTDDNIKDLL